MSRLLAVGILSVTFAMCMLFTGAPRRAGADVSAAGSASAKAKEDAALGAVDVTGAATTRPQRMALVPLLSSGDPDVIVQLVVRRDFELSGQFDVQSSDVAPKGPWLRSTPVEPAAWGALDIDVLLRVMADETKAGEVTLTGEVWLPKSGKTAAVGTKTTTAPRGQARRASHRLADQLLGLLTGRDGGFSSRMTFVRKIGSGQQALVADADGLNLRGVSPAAEIAISPAFGPRDDIWYALSEASRPFRIVSGDPPRTVPITIEGSVMGLSISSDRTRLAVALMRDGVSSLYVGNVDGSAMRAMPTGNFATHPVLGPSGKLAWVAGTPPRVYVDGKPISPAGFAASSPTFCDSPRGLYVVYSVGVLDGADLVASDVNGSGLMRLTQSQGGNADPACSPDGRLVAYFSTRKSGKGPGLYLMPIAAPWRAQRVLDVMGSSLRWEATLP